MTDIDALIERLRAWAKADPGVHRSDDMLAAADALAELQRERDAERKAWANYGREITTFREQFKELEHDRHRGSYQSHRSPDRP